MNTKEKVRLFKRRHKIRVVNSATLCDALKVQGFTIIEFNGVSDNKDVADLIDALQLKDYISSEKCFAFQNDKYRLVFLHEDLNENERTVVLAHEEGHIWNGHLTQDCVFGTDVIQEYEANEFAHYLLIDRTGKKKRIKICVAMLVLFLMIGVGLGVFLKQQSDNGIYTDNLYRTDTGTKYHLRECMYIKDKTNVYRLTREEFESGEYEPCGACIPRGTTDNE
ncbi:ImmA/IrrE family metallo-endopeptidase [Ruminococcus sp.]|uniref:ImmA/IrrE family metallo-endopeptidase n=1 Tax=Ruminococcus sp. TaxID=41978 RepID=UPI002E814194|nr:ImmA/IrrE family metallo-endopeptidase [Ruminococcus sp.]MEE3491536.1 ImmA/IrrE family metallo-endopeptidase [Ruminococcus sp.]